MSREYLYLMLGLCLILLSIFFLIKKPQTSPDRIITYKTIDDISLKLHIFDAKSRQTSNTAPALLLFHGGAWQYGSPLAFYKQCEYFSSMGLTCISVQYRIEAIHDTDPRAAIQDARAALGYVQKHAETLRINVNHIAVGGGSAGGHLAAILGIPIPLPDEEIYNRPNALILYNPMLDLSPGHPDHHLVSSFWDDVSPLQHIDEKTPDTLIMVGTEDTEVPVLTVKKFCTTMESLGGNCKLELFEGARHGFFNFSKKNPGYFNATNKQVVHFLRQRGFFDGSLEGNTEK